MAPRLRLLLSFIAIVGLSLEPWAVSATCEFPAVVNFGDSNSDTGGFSAVFGQAIAPAGETYFGAPAGRYSDGRLIIDFIAENVGLPHLSAYLDAMGSNFTHGANFATAASTIRPPNGTLSESGVSPISLDVQWTEFNDFRRRSRIIHDRGGVFSGLMPKEDYFSRALYTFDIGQNDLTYGYFRNMSTEQVRDYVPEVLGQFKTVIKDIHDRGGRSFWIHNTGPVGCLPYILDRVPITAGQVDRYGCAAPFNEVAKYFNAKLRETVRNLRKELPEAAITYVDVYTVKHTLITNAEKFGFVQPLKACCGHGGKYNYNMHVGCGGTVKVEGKEIVVGSCKDPSVKISWDGVHYTEAANKWIFDKIVGGAYSDPPIPLSGACQRHPAQ